ncbi:MAG TPA: hypothetical protein P5180_04690 [Bacteroidales bacterium]|nr:hypothetical protein [Bacteroidales bacterium]HRW84707.1 hypothetical protein [Bacteroidales bacterium]
MGEKRIYKFSKCGYSLMSSGGKDYGMLAVTDTYICTSCKKIVDVCIGEYGKTYPRKEVLTKEIRSEAGLDLYVCPSCGSEKNLVKWNKSKRPCPQCGEKMQADKSGLTVLWD